MYNNTHTHTHIAPHKTTQDEKYVHESRAIIISHIEKISILEYMAAVCRVARFVDDYLC